MTWDFNLAVLIPVFLSAALTYALYRVNKAQDERDRRLTRTEDDLHQFKIEVATHYIRSPEIDALRQEVSALRSEFNTEFRALTGAVNRLVGQLHGKS